MPGATLWLRASSLAASHKDGDAVSVWVSDATATAHGAVSQQNSTASPTFARNAFGLGAAGVRFDGVATFLDDKALPLPGSAGSTHFAVFRDVGSTGQCCNGPLYWDNAAGISTSTVAAPGKGMIVNADGPGYTVAGALNVLNRTVVAMATYSATGGKVALSVESCNYTGTYPRSSLGDATGVMVGSRNDQLGRFFKGDVGEIIVYPRVLSQAEQAAIRAYLASQWPQAGPRRTDQAQCAGATGDQGFKTSQMYAITRYTQAVQSRNTTWPIKFNGQAWIASRGANGEPDSRDWGACNWWQNTRLPYGAMLAAGDFDVFEVLMKYILNQEKLLSQRTQLYWGHPGMWTTETAHLTGAYCPQDYFGYKGCKANRTGWPVWLEQSGYLALDQGGDSGTGEYSLMVRTRVLHPLRFL